jgi:mannitol-1-phosphate/altronate dehydrogenase
MVQAVRAAGGRYSINIALPDRIEKAEVSGVELHNPSVPEDRQRILDAIAESDELATSLPSVSFFDRGAETSVARMLAQGFALRKNGRPAIVYTAENNNHAAELLLDAVNMHCPSSALANVQFLNTVIGKMSGVISDPATISKLSLAPMTPGGPKAVLVEEFNRILISHITLQGFTRGINVFVEKPDLLPFEEAKLYGHNAVHALIAYLAEQRGLVAVSDAAAHSDIMATARAAFLEESGAALVQKHARLGDSLFTTQGFRAYAEDLLGRMVRPTLNDLVSRVTRDHVRKLGYDDRIFGAMRLALDHGIEPVNVAKGAAAAVSSLTKNWDIKDASLSRLPCPSNPLTREGLSGLLRAIWENKADHNADRLIDLTLNAGRL